MCVCVIELIFDYIKYMLYNILYIKYCICITGNVQPIGYMCMVGKTARRVLLIAYRL
jgi:hypothetical protein